jgi:hypothetical protein
VERVLILPESSLCCWYVLSSLDWVVADDSGGKEDSDGIDPISK